ncbi:hypothetical protein BS50DRAFT_97408, partial [Corynespora cassiicola Philippines]
MLAADGGNLDIMEYLLDKGADPDAIDVDGWAPIHRASGKGQSDAVQKLINRKAKMNLQTHYSGATSLHIAADRGFAGIVGLLKNQGADMDAKTWEGKTVLHWAIECLYQKDDTNYDNLASSTVNDEEGAEYEDNQVQATYEIQNTQVEGNYKEICDYLLKTKDKWKEVLWIAQVEADEKNFMFVVREAYPRNLRQWVVLRRVWLAMDERKHTQLEAKLRQEAIRFEIDVPSSWNVLQIAACLRKVHTVSWLLRSKIWTPQEIDDAKKIQEYLEEDQEAIMGPEESIWNTPFIQPGRKMTHSFGERPVPNTYSSKLRAAIIDFQTLGQTVDLTYFNCDLLSIIYGDGNDNSRKSGYHELLKACARSAAAPAALTENELDDAVNHHKWPTVRWVHLPANSIDWMMDLATTIYRGRSKENTQVETRGHLHAFQRSWDELSRHDEKNKYMHPRCVKIQRPRYQEATSQSSHETSGATRLALYGSKANLSWNPMFLTLTQMPYITIGLCDPKNGEDEDALREHHKDKILHCSRTLDQYFHGKKTEHLDEDQVFTRYADAKNWARLQDTSEVPRRGQDEQVQEDPAGEAQDNLAGLAQENTPHVGTQIRSGLKILRVHQLWLWVLDNDTIVSSETHPLDDGEGLITAGLFDRFREFQDRPDHMGKPFPIDNIVKFITSHYINAMDNLTTEVSETDDTPNPTNRNNTPTGQGENQTGRGRPGPLNLQAIFSNSIEQDNKRETKLRTEFKKTIKERIKKDSASKGGTNRDLGPPQEASNKRTTTTDPDIYDAIDQALEILTDIKDIRNELSVLKSLAETQRLVWDQLLTATSTPATRPSQAARWSTTDPAYVLSRIDALLDHSAETHNNITSILDLEMNQLSVSEAELARKQGEILMVFTVVTIFFLPMSFLSSLFALNVESFPHRGDEVSYRPGYVFGIIFGVTAGFCVLLAPFLPFDVLRARVG